MNKIQFTLICTFIISSTGYGQRQIEKLLLLDTVPELNYVVFYNNCDKGGNTSVAFDSENQHNCSGASAFKADGWGYYTKDGSEIPYIKRDRDLGQTFLYKAADNKELQSITVRLGFGTNVIRPGMYGKNISLQLYEVAGSSTINNNGSDSTLQAFHGWPHDRNGKGMHHSRDDYYDGEKYNTIAIVRGYKFPKKNNFGINDKEEVSPDDPRLKGKYLKFELPASSKIILKPNRKYAFLIMIDSIGKERGFTLSNNYLGTYINGHGIRRDGNGVFPPAPCNPQKNFTDPENKKAYEAAHFPPDFNTRNRIAPGTNGYPDVDTWRDIVFFIEAK